MDSETLQATIDRVFSSDDLLDALRQRVRRRLYTTLKVAPHATEGLDLTVELRNALFLGVHRARLNRFCQLRGLTMEQLVQLRREFGTSTRHRQSDSHIVGMCFEEFYTFECTPPLSDEEILEAAHVEFRDSIAGPHSEYSDLMKRARYVGTLCPTTVDSTLPVDYDPLEDLEREEHPLGLAFSRAAAVALEMYGPSGMYWLAKQLCYNTAYTAMLKDLGDVDAEDKQRYWQQMNGLVRKMPKINERIMAVLRQDPLLLELYARRFGAIPEDRVDPLPDVVSSDVKTFRRERDRYQTRVLARCVQWLQRKQESELIEVLRTLTPEEVAEVVRRFVKFEQLEMRGETAFLRDLRKQYLTVVQAA